MGKILEFLGREIIKLERRIPFVPPIGLSPKIRGAGVVTGAVIAASIAIPGAAAFLGKGLLKVGKFVAPKTLKGAVITGTAGLIGGGILASSPKARRVVKEKIVSAPKEIFGLGKSLGGAIEGGKAPSIKEGLKKAGIIGAGAAAAAAVIAGVTQIPKAIAKIPKRKEKVTALPLPISPLPTEITPTLTEIPGEVRPEAAVVPVTALQPPAIKNIFNPCINIQIKNTGVKKTFKRQEIFCVQ